MRLKGNGSYTHHGFCLNVNKNQSYFDLIDPCGFPVEEVKPISMEEINGEVINYLDVKNKIVENFKEVFGKNGEA
jgi:lipoate-protein ligase B